jgi:hypothetical protein
MGVINIDYDTLMLVIILLFAAVGFIRGWLREGVTTVLLLLLLFLLYNPSVVSPIVRIVDRLLMLVRVVIADAGRFDLSGMAQAAGEIEPLFTPDNPYNFLLWLLIILIIASYAFSKLALSNVNMSPLSRILGGILGAINGFIAISLFREYVVRYLMGMTEAQAEAGAMATTQAVAPDAVGISLQNVPAASFMASVGPLLAILAGIGILVLILSSLFKWKLA